jgi:hypothetical protein
MKRLLALSLALVLSAVSGCSKLRPALPDVLPGAHSPSYDTITGRLERVPSKDPTEGPTWVLRYGLNTDDSYRGEVALMPPPALTGYSGGELVVVLGAIDPTFKSPNYPGTWYNVRSIQHFPSSEAR